MNTRTRRGVWPAGAAALVIAAALSACASDVDSSTDGTTDSSAAVAEASANVDRYFTNATTAFALDPVSDPDALRGKTVMYLSAGLSSPAGTAGLQALAPLASTLGFELVSFDGEFSPSVAQDGLRQAIAQKVDAIIDFGIDCPGNEAALREVRDAGIVVVGLQAVDCNQADPAAQSYFDAQPLYPIGDSSGPALEFWKASGAAQADYLISTLDGDVKVIQFDVPDYVVMNTLGDGFRERMAQCPTCEIVESVTVNIADYGPALQQKAEQALLKHPDANAVQVVSDDLITLGVAGAVTGSGRGDELLVIAGQPYENTLDLIRENRGLDAGWGQDFELDHYAALDTTLRLLAGQETAVSGIPINLYDADHNLPASGPFVPGFDFPSLFLAAWGAE